MPDDASNGQAAPPALNISADFLTGSTDVGGSARVLGMNTETDRIAIFQRTAFVSEKKTLYPLLTPNELVRFSRGFYPTWDDAAVGKY
jgi:ABC-type multidrug transport system ATPase subunit